LPFSRFFTPRAQGPRPDPHDQVPRPPKRRERPGDGLRFRIPCRLCRPAGNRGLPSRGRAPAVALHQVLRADPADFLFRRRRQRLTSARLSHT
jgi:hypothetical protein